MLVKGDPGLRTLISDFIGIEGYVITHPCPIFYGGLAKPTLKSNMVSLLHPTYDNGYNYLSIP